MSVFLFVLGALCALGGLAAVGFGIPVKEFSFGNTLIVAGATGVVGGFIVIGLGAAISQLQRIGEMLGARPLARSGRPLEPFEQPGVRVGPGPGRVPFPPKPKLEPRDQVTQPTAPPPPIDESPVESDFAAPSLRNPDVPLMAEDEAQELPLSPRPGGSTAPADAEFFEPPRNSAARPEAAEQSPDQVSFEPPWRSARPRPPQPDFDEMWPATERNPPPPAAPERAASRAESIPRTAAAEPMRPPPPELPSHDVQPVAILKSGVVDGMGYTLYVDGSIEAELPDGTLHFASINELRTHLEKNS